MYKFQQQPSQVQLLAVSVCGVILLTVLLFLAGTNNVTLAADSVTLPTFKTQVIKLQTSYNYPQKVVGRVEAKQTSVLSFDTVGTVKDVMVDEGQTVDKGQVLATLRSDRLVAQKNELKSTKQRVEADVRLAKISQQRIEKLVSEKLSSIQSLDESKAQLDVAEASLAQVLAQLARVQVEIDRAELIAPYSGSVVIRHLDAGVAVSPGSPILTIQSNSELEVRASLPSSVREKITLGDQVSLLDSASKATVSRFISRENSLTRTQDAILTLPNNMQSSLRSGQIVGLTVPMNREDKGVWLPISALNSGSRGLWTVLVAVKQQAEWQLEARLVEVLYTNGQDAYVSGALSEGDRVVSEGTQRLVPKQRVQLVRD